jgi:hypothetical protein
MKTLFDTFFAEFRKYGADMFEQETREYTFNSLLYLNRGIRYWGGSKKVADTIVKTFEDKYPDYNFWVFPGEKGWLDIRVNEKAKL